MPEGEAGKRRRVRRRWLAALLFAIGMLVGAVLESVLVSAMIVVGACVRTAWVFHSHMRVESGGKDSRV